MIFHLVLSKSDVTAPSYGEIQNNITNFRKEKEKLVSEKHRLENDIDYIEKLAREKYRMAKPGEKVFKVIDSNKKAEKE